MIDASFHSGRACTMCQYWIGLSTCRGITRPRQPGWHGMAWYGVTIGLTTEKNRWWWSGSGYWFRITFPLPSPLQNRALRRLIRTSHTVARRFWRNAAKWLMGMKTTTFWERSSGHPAPDQNYLITFGWVQGIRCTWSWWRYAISLVRETAWCLNISRSHSKSIEMTPLSRAIGPPL